MNITIWGLYRTGTNWMGDVCKMNFDTIVNAQLDGRKHCFLSDSGTQHRPQKLWGTTLWRVLEKENPENTLHIVMKKNEDNWLHSMTRKRVSKNGANFFYDVFGEHSEEQMLRHYKMYYLQWEQFNIDNKLILPYEEMLINPKKVLDFISQKWDIKQKPFNLPQRNSISQSKDLTQERIDLYVKNYKTPNENIIYNKSY